MRLQQTVNKISCDYIIKIKLHQSIGMNELKPIGLHLIFRFHQN